MSDLAFAGPAACGVCTRPLPAEQQQRARCACGREVEVFRFRPWRAVAAGAAAATAGAACAYHAGNEPVASCQRCGSFICALCMTPVGAETYCTDCFSRLKGAGSLRLLDNRVPRPQWAALVLGWFAFLPALGVVAALGALWYAARAVRRRAELTQRERVLLPALGGALLALCGLGANALYFRDALR